MISFSSKILDIDSDYFSQWAQTKDVLLGCHGSIDKIRGYQNYNRLVDLNGVFSSHPKGEPTDRTGTVLTPLRHYAGRPWTRSSQIIDLDQALFLRVRDIESCQQKINIMWSGGVDSTTAVNAMIKNLQHRDQLRVLYSPYSEYEHGGYLEFLSKNGVETVDMSGDTYMHTVFDGVFITGDTGDESFASMDESFIEAHGMDVLWQPWRDFFHQQTHDQEFMDFCYMYFDLAPIPIHSLLEARWWFYINSKYRCMLNRKLYFWLDYPNFSRDLVQGFFDCDWFDQWISQNTHTIIRPEGYYTWKQDLKDYCLSIDGFEDWNKHKIKINSNQLAIYGRKKKNMKDLHALFIMDDGTRITTPNMPLFSVDELYSIYGSSLDGLWNAPDQI